MYFYLLPLLRRETLLSGLCFCHESCMLFSSFRWQLWPSQQCWASLPSAFIRWKKSPPMDWFLEKGYVAQICQQVCYHTTHCHKLNHFEFIFSLWLCLFCQLNIYTPLARSAQAPVAPERPGFIQSGITTARESIQPLVQASKVFTFDIINLR